MVDLEQLLPALSGAGVEFIVVEGVAVIVHSSARLTYRRTPENISRLATALRLFAPYLRGAPPGLPFMTPKIVQRGHLVR